MTSNTNILTTRTSANPESVRSLSGFTRPANTAAYADGDVIFDTVATGVIQFDNAGASGSITNASVFMLQAATANLELFVFDAEPTNFGDNTALTLVSGDFNKLVGVFTLADSTKKLGAAAVAIYESTTQGAIAYTSTSGKLYGVLVTRSAFTPTSGTAYGAALHLQVDCHI
tara:strand:- start:18393 stop:18908 length:516 start_codon:yes stop_codon:yes gene_type:complete